jgi:hypothetical protein
VTAHSRGRAYDRFVRIRWRARELRRTCLSCGWVWQVPKGMARPHMRGLPEAHVGDQGAVNDVIAANAVLGEQAATLKQCPHCGSTRYRQKAVRS